MSLLPRKLVSGACSQPKTSNRQVLIIRWGSLAAGRAVGAGKRSGSYCRVPLGIIQSSLVQDYLCSLITSEPLHRHSSFRATRKRHTLLSALSNQVSEALRLSCTGHPPLIWSWWLPLPAGSGAVSWMLRTGVSKSLLALCLGQPALLEKASFSSCPSSLGTTIRDE